MNKFLLAFLAIFLATSCGPQKTQVVNNSQHCPPTGSATRLVGAGASAPAPLYSRWFHEYERLCGVQINYQPIGSGGGISQITAKNVDFGASDGILTQAQFDAAPGIMMVPMTTPSVVLVYNVPEIKELRLTSDQISKIYLGTITNWNQLDASYPNLQIIVIHRSDGSGTTNIFTNYLNKVSTEWSNTVGTGNSVKWPVGLGGEQNAGVAGQVNQLLGTIGYVEIAYAVQNKMSYASVYNSSNNLVRPNVDSITAAMRDVELPDDMKIMITDSKNVDGYPIAGLTWLLVYSSMEDTAKKNSLQAFIKWALNDGQDIAKSMSYAPLSEEARFKANAIVDRM